MSPDGPRDVNVDPGAYTALCSDPAGLSQVCENQVKQLGRSSGQNFLIRHFILPKASCKDKKSVQSFCAFVQSFDGYETLSREDALVPDAADPDYVHLTRRASALPNCAAPPPKPSGPACAPRRTPPGNGNSPTPSAPTEGKAIYVRECVKPTTTDGEGAGRVLRAHAGRVRKGLRCQA